MSPVHGRPGARVPEDLGGSRLRGGAGPTIPARNLAQTRIHSALDEYSHVGLDQLKQRFSALDLEHGPGADAGNQEEGHGPVKRLRPLSPEWMERAWAQLVEGLLGHI